MATSLRLARILLAGCLWPGVAVAAGTADEYPDLLDRTPDSANVLLLANVEAILASELAVREGWAGLSEDAQSRCMIFPVDAKRMVVAARLDLRDMDYDWKIALAVARDRLPALPVVADRERGRIEQVAGASVVWTPRDLFIIEFPPQIIGFVSPADRQALARWLRSTAVGTKAVRPAFADRAIALAGRDAPLLLAVDLSDTVSPSRALDKLRTLEPAVRTRTDPAALAAVLGTVRGAYFSLDIRDAVRGTLRVEFDESAEALGPIARDLVIAALEEVGAEIPDLAQWSARVDGRAIVLSGALSRESTRRVLSLIRPIHFDGSPAARPAQPGAEPAPATPNAEVTRRYYRAVVDLLDGLKQEKARSLNGLAVWYDRYARNIDDLPLLGVDSDMLVFGSRTSLTLREIAVGIRHSANVRSHRRAEVMHLDAYHAALINRQEDAHLAQYVTEKTEAIRAAAAETRRAMTERYRVEF